MLVLRWQRLVDEKGHTCPRCGTTEVELERALSEIIPVRPISEISGLKVLKAYCG